VGAGFGGGSLFDDPHRHRYEVNNGYRDALSHAGMVFSGTSPDGHLVEMAEIKDHPFFIGSQFHPEFKSRPLRPHPLFRGFVGACRSLNRTDKVVSEVNREASTAGEQTLR
jgi:CTP synthase